MPVPGQERETDMRTEHFKTTTKQTEGTLSSAVLRALSLGHLTSHTTTSPFLVIVGVPGKLARGSEARPHTVVTQEL